MNRQNNYLCFIFLRFILYLIALFFKEFIGFKETILGILFILGAVFFTIKLIRDGMLVTPLVLGELLLVSFGLYELHLVNSMTYMEVKGIVVILTSILMWELVCIFNKRLFEFGRIKTINIKKGNMHLKYTILITFFLCTFLNMLEWYIAGGIPLLRKDVETFRFTVVFNSTVHVIAMCIKYIPFLIGIYAAFDIRYLVKKQKLMCVVFVGSIIVLLGTGFRGELMAGIFMLAIAYFIYKRPKLLLLIKIAIPFSIIMAVYPVMRSYVIYGDSYVLSMMEISSYPQFWFLTPLYQTFAASFHYLNKDFSLFPQMAPFGMGQYTFLSNVPFISGVETLAETQNRVWNNGFYAELTATVFGSWYADFGYVGCVIGLVFLSLLCNAFFNNFVKKPTAKGLALYIFIFYKGFQMIYDNTFDFVAILYLIYFWLVFSIKYGHSKSIM